MYVILPHNGKVLFLVQCNDANAEGVCYFDFTCPNNAMISDCCDCIGIQVYILVEFSFPRIFKQDFVPFVVRVLFLIAVFLLISFIN